MTPTRMTWAEAEAFLAARGDRPDVEDFADAFWNTVELIEDEGEGEPRPG